MAGIRMSARLKEVTATCGHKSYAYVPPADSIGPVGRRNIEKARTSPCSECYTTDMIALRQQGYPTPLTLSRDR